MEIPTGSPFRYRRDRDREEERWAGRHALHFAYALGCLEALGDDKALEVLRALGLAESRTVKRALLDQFRRGQVHERTRGAYTSEET
jgi:hypothetical protein